MSELPEPWLRGPLTDVHPLIMPVCFSFQQVREDLQRFTAGVSESRVWQRIGKASLGFHLKHIAGSVDRLSTYLAGGELNEMQLGFLREEGEGAETLNELLQMVHTSLAGAEDRLRQVDPEKLYESRFVGRQHLPTTVIGLLLHMAEHTQRHLGQAVILSQMPPMS